MAASSRLPRGRLASPDLALQVIALLGPCLTLQGCRLITIGYCHPHKIEHGSISGTWENDRAEIVCDDGYEPPDIEFTCQWQRCALKSRDEAMAEVGAEAGECRSGGSFLVAGKPDAQRRLLQRSEPGLPARAGPGAVPNASGSAHPANTDGASGATAAASGDRAGAAAALFWPRCLPRGEAGSKGGGGGPRRGSVERWVRAFARGATAGEGGAGAGEEFAALLEASIDVAAVHECAGSRAAFVEMRITIGNKTNSTSNVTDFMEFDSEGNATEKTRRAIVRTIQDIETGQGPSSLAISGLPTNGNDLYLYKIFAPFGAIKSVKADSNEDGTCTGSGIVEFAHLADAEKAARKFNEHVAPNVQSINPNQKAVLKVSVESPGAKKKKTA